MPRIALVETVNELLHRHRGAEAFPFLLGHLRARGDEVEWWVLQVPDALLHAGGRHVFGLPAQAEAGLLARLSGWRPELVVFHNRPVPHVREAVERASPGARVLDLYALPPLGRLTRGEVERAFFGSVPGDDGELLVDAAPLFERRPLDDSPLVPQPLVLAEDTVCAYRLPVAGNAAYAAVAGDPAVRGHLGCSFCLRASQPPGRPRPRTPAVELALRQIDAHQRGHPGAAGGFEYHLDSGTTCARLGTFFEAVLARGLRPSTFFVMPRADELLAQRERLEQLLPRLRDAGHAVRLLSTGAENFSPEENLRLHKGLDESQLWECLALIRDFSERFPETFAPEDGLFSGILFTPWTRPEDLARNLEAAERLGDAWLKRVMGTRLQLLESAAITRLARHEGVLAERFGSAADVAAVCLSGPNEIELPWRFRDPRTEVLHRLLIRLEPIPPQATVAPDDALVAALRPLRALLPDGIAHPYVKLARCLVDAALALGHEVTVERLLERAERDLRRDFAREAPPSTPEGEEGGSGEVRIVFARRGEPPAYVFRVGASAAGVPAFRTVGEVRIVHEPCRVDADFELCARFVAALARAMGRPPTGADTPAWAAAASRGAARPPMERFEVSVAG